MVPKVSKDQPVNAAGIVVVLGEHDHRFAHTARLRHSVRVTASDEFR
jgi:hypothetical protein